MQDKKAVEQFKQIKCEICNEKASSIIRGMYTCSKCFSILSKDNNRLFKQNKDIPQDTSYLKRCSYYPCENKFMSKIQFKDNEITKEYCSEICKIKDQEVQNRKYIY